jgi:hypothetical protein
MKDGGFNLLVRTQRLLMGTELGNQAACRDQHSCQTLRETATHHD